MASNRKSIPPYIQRSLLVLIIFLMGISVARFFVSMHQQEERLEILEAQVAQLLADTTRLQIPPQPTYNRNYHQQTGNYHHTYNRNNYNHSRQGHSTQGQRKPDQTPQSADVIVDSTARANVPQSSSFISQTGERPRKFTEPHLFDLNTIDSLTLIRIPGIAARTASVILKNRQRYGGFYNPWQLQEFLTWDTAKDYMEEWCTVWFTADANRLRLIHVNEATVSELQRHPYISHEQAVEIVRYRTRHKRLASIAEFQQLSTFSAEQLQQILPYLTFE
jgi:DNA uptake protein ComE-like DNA-binding protein